MNDQNSSIAGVLTIMVMAMLFQPQAAWCQTTLFQPPLGLPALPVPADNHITAEKVELGKMLYFDKRLSKDNSVACATCHKPGYAYAEPLKSSVGINSQIGDKNAPTIVNAAYMTSMFWDGRMKTLEEQAAGPVENPIEMGHKIEDVAAALNAVPEYKKRFEDAFGQPACKETITKAIAAFERTILSGNSPYDRYVNGDPSALSEDAQKGMQLFMGKALCATCHKAPLFANGNFVNTGIGDNAPGRFAVTKLATDKGAHRVPALREAVNTAPYFHDGSVATLEEAVKIMAGGGVDNPNRHAALRVMPKWSEEEIGQLVEFIKALSGEYPVVEEPELP